MNSYANITCWENMRRLGKLAEFRNHVVNYFNNSHHNKWRLEDSLIENEQARRARLKINLIVDEIHSIVLAAGVNPIIGWAPPPVVGGYIKNVDVMMNLFNIHRFKITPNHAVSFLERAIGVYQSDRRKSVFRTFNPLWWVRRLIYWFARIPFTFIDAAGFDVTKAEGSILGRIVKAVFSLIPVIASLLAVFYHMGWLDELKSALGIGT